MRRADAKKTKSRIVSFRLDEDDFALLDALARQTSYSCGEVLRRCLTSAQLKSTIDAQALTEVSRLHADLNRIGGLLKLAVRVSVPRLAMAFVSTLAQGHERARETRKALEAFVDQHERLSTVRVDAA